MSSLLPRYLGKDVTSDEATNIVKEFKTLNGLDHDDLASEFLSALMQKPGAMLNRYVATKVFGIGEHRFNRIVKGERKRKCPTTHGTIKELVFYNNFLQTYLSADCNTGSFNKYDFYLNNTSIWFPEGGRPTHPLITVRKTFYRKMREIQDGKYNTEMNICKVTDETSTKALSGRIS
jgi:hypothetical protein